MQTLQTICPGKKTQLLEWLLFHPTTGIKVREISKTLGINAGYVSTFLKELQKADVIKEKKLNTANPTVKAFKIVFNVDRIKKGVSKLKDNWIVGIGIYGSWAKGTNIEDSDIDLWIRVTKEPSVKEVSEIRAILRESTGANEISIAVLTEKRLDEIRKKDPIFYSTLLTSFHLRGEFID